MVSTRSQSKAAAAPAATSIVSAENALTEQDTSEQFTAGAKPRSQKTGVNEAYQTYAAIDRRLEDDGTRPKQKSKAASVTKKTTSSARTKTAKRDSRRKRSPSPQFRTPEFTPGQQSTIFDLPAELRNDIWTLALLQKAPIDVSPMRPFIHEPALLAVSRQVRSETMSLWYAESSFRINGSSPAVKFLRSRDDQQLRSIRSLCIVTEKSKEMVDSPGTWARHLRSKVETVMREFEGRGLRRWALKFQVYQEGELRWIDGDELQDHEVAGPVKRSKKSSGGPEKSEAGARAAN